MISYSIQRWMFIISLFSITCIAGLLLLQAVCGSSLDEQYTSLEPIEIMPSFQVNVEWLHLAVVILYTTGLVYTSNAWIHWYFVPLAVFMGIQFLYSTWILLDRETYIKQQLEMSWQAASAENITILQNIQNQWQCQGFETIEDRPALMQDTTMMTDACYPILASTFGSTVFVWGVGLWAVKIIQAVGLLACYAIFSQIRQNESEGIIALPQEEEEQGLLLLSEYETDEEDDDDEATIVVSPAMSSTLVNEKSITFSL